MLRGLVTKVFGGNSTAAVQQLLAETEIGADEIAEIRQMLDQLERDKPRQRKRGKR